MSSSSRKKTRSTSAGDAMKLVAKPEPALTYAARDSFAFSEGPQEPAAPAEPAVPAAKPAAAKPVAAPPTASVEPTAAARPWTPPKPAFVDPSSLFGGSYDRFAALGTGNVEAVATASAVLVKGLEEMGQSVVELGQRNLESSLKLAKAAIGTTTLRQLVDLQTGYARDNFDRLVAEGSKLQEISLKIASAALQPFQARMAQAMDSLSSRAA